MLLKLVREGHHPQRNQSWTNMDWVIILRETSPGPTWTEGPLSQEEDITPETEQRQITVWRCSQGQRASFLETCPGLMELKLNCLDMMTIVTSGGERPENTIQL